VYELTLRTPGLTWVRAATNVTEMMAILQAAQMPGCKVEVSDKSGVRIPFDLLVSGGTAAPATDVLALAA
jgi:hypothetical protein